VDEAMRKVTLWSGCLTLVVVGLGMGHASQKPRAFADIALYEAVLNQLFDTASHKGRSESTTILRYTHGDAAEMQLAFNRVGQFYRVERWGLPAGARSVWQQLAQLASSDVPLSQETAVRAIKIERATGVIAADSPIGRLLQQASSLRVELSGSDEFFLDGAEYVIAISSVGRDLRLRLQGPADGERSSDPAIRWMAQVRRELGDADLTPTGRR
jgi:hypothetical protein